MTKTLCVALVAGLSVGFVGTSASGQIVVNSIERSVAANSELGNGGSDANGDSSESSGLFSRNFNVLLPGPGGAQADSFVGQVTNVTGASVSGQMSSGANVKTGTTFVTGQGTGQSNFLLLFTLAAPTPVSFVSSGSITLNGVNPNGEPSDLYGRAYVRLIDTNTDDQIAGFSLFPTAGSDSATFNGTLPAGSYALMAQAFTFAFSADLIGPPNRSGNGSSQVDFSLLVVPAPASAGLLGLGLLAARRRRR
jgi:hypothetical protein